MKGGCPTKDHEQLYQAWSEHPWGMILTGNVQVSSTHLGSGRDLIVDSDLDAFVRLASIIKRNGKSLAIMQLSHAGRQSANIVGGRKPFVAPLAPSTVALGHKSDGFLARILQRLMFTKPQEMTLSDIDEVVDQFVKGARLARLSGFDGIELHAAHGCMSNAFRDCFTLLISG
jgi:2,4-dienoyl-CoA reductase-like NADH-dependent reductase (Old Yellow Enzyme family)